MAFGFAIARFGLFLRELAATQVTRIPARSLGSGWFGVVLVVFGLVINAAATVRFGALRKAIMERRSAAPSPTLAYVVGAVSVVVALTMAIVLAASLESQ